MNKNELNIEIHNEEELLKVYENDKKNAKNDQEKAKWEKHIEDTENTISDLEEEKLDK